jgi:lipid A 3-O-deacylase
LRLSGFQDRRIRPLCHPSDAAAAPIQWTRRGRLLYLRNMPSRPSRAVLAAATLSLLAAAAVAQAPAPVSRDAVSNLTVTYENDQFGGADKYYTTGWQLAWRSTAPDLPPAIAAAASWPRLLFPQNGTVRWGLAFGQNIYTPEDTSLQNPDPNDRPYAGWLYGSLTIASFTEQSLGSVELQLGIVGPAALGEQVQNNVHWLLGIETSAGWDYQLENEPGINLIFSRQWRASWPVNSANPDGLAYGIVPSVAASLGNVQTYAAAGFMVKFGSNLESDFGPQRIRPAAGGSAFFRPNGRWGWYILAGVEGRAIARDIFLDGNTWADSRSVDKHPLVGDAIVGAVLIMPRARLTYTHTFRSEEFKGQGKKTQFGSISLSMPF